MAYRAARRCCFIAVLLAIWCVTPGQASGQRPTDTSETSYHPALSGDFPAQPLTIIVPRGAGGGSHQVSSLMANLLKERHGWTVNLVNIPGGAGKDAITYYMSLPPTGYTILQHVDDIASLYARDEISVNPTRDLIPLSIVQITFSQLYIRDRETRFITWHDFMRYVRTHPHQIRIAQVGHHGSMESFMLDMLAQTLDLNIIKVPFSHPASRYLSLISGDADALIEQPGDVSQFLDAHHIRPILTLSKQPQHAQKRPDLDMSDVPALPALAADADDMSHIELLYDLYRFRGFFVHADVSPSRLSRLQAAFEDVALSPQFKAINAMTFMLSNSHRDTASAKELIGDTIDTYKTLKARLTPGQISGD